jgi:hypothetical protein
MEGIAFGKKVAILGRPSYDIYRGARVIGSPEEIFDHVADSSWQPEAMADERRAFLAALSASTFFLGHPQAINPWPRAEEAGLNYARALDRFLIWADRQKPSVAQLGAAL